MLRRVGLAVDPSRSQGTSARVLRRPAATNAHRRERAVGRAVDRVRRRADLDTRHHGPGSGSRSPPTVARRDRGRSGIRQSRPRRGRPALRTSLCDVCGRDRGGRRRRLPVSRPTTPVHRSAPRRARRTTPTSRTARRNPRPGRRLDEPRGRLPVRAAVLKAWELCHGEWPADRRGSSPPSSSVTSSPRIAPT